MRPELFRRLRLRLTMWYAGIFSLVLVCFGFGTWAYMRHALVAAIDDLNQETVEFLVSSLQERNYFITRQFLAESKIVAALRADMIIELFDAKGQLVTSQQRGEGVIPPGGPVRESGKWLRQPLRVQRQPLVGNGVFLGVLVVGQSLDDVEVALRKLVWTMAGAIPLTTVAILVAGALLSEKAIRPIRDVFELQRRFLADVSHELRTPVAILQAQAEVALQDPASDPARLRESLEVVRRTAERMNRLVQQLLFLSRADAALVSPQRKRFFLDDLLEELVEEFTPLAEARGLTLKLDVAAPDLAVAADPDQLHQLLAILLDNAIKYTDGPGEIRLQAKSERSPARVVLTVADTGPGIPPQDLPHVFERFYRGDPSRSAGKPGHGLGLAIARIIAEAHGGRLEVSSDPGRGTVAQLTLPAE